MIYKFKNIHFQKKKNKKHVKFLKQNYKMNNLPNLNFLQK